VNAVFSTSRHRILIAVVLSLLLHAAAIWLLPFYIRHDEGGLPSLTVRLEPKHSLALLAENSQTEIQHGNLGVVEVARQESSAEYPLKDELTQTVIAPVAENLQTETQAENPIVTEITKPEASIAYSMPELTQSDSIHTLPKHLQLAFAVYKNSDALASGEIHQQLDISGDRYSLKSIRETSGITDLIKKREASQSSEGKIGESGLQPETFKEEKTGAGDNQRVEVTFDRAAQQLHFLQGKDTKLPADAQDALSFMYQFSQISTHGEIIPLSISNGTRLESLRIEIGAVEDVPTPIGKLRALHLRSMHEKGEAYFEIWLGLDYRMLPIKFRQTDGSANITDEFVISDIRGVDE